MHVATLEEQCINTIVNCIEKQECVEPHLCHALIGCQYEVLTHRVFNVLVQKYPYSVNDELLQLFCHGRFDKIVLRGCIAITHAGLRSILVKCHSVKVLDISQCDQLLTRELPSLLREYANDLKTLVIENSSLKNDLLQLLLDLPIQEISVEGSQGLDDNSTSMYSPFVGRFSGCLTTVNVSSCQTITTTFVRHLTAVHGPTLKSVNISWTNIDCLSLIYLAGYTISSKACFTLKDFISINDTTYQSNLAQLFSPKSTTPMESAQQNNISQLFTFQSTTPTDDTIQRSDQPYLLSQQISLTPIDTSQQSNIAQFDQSQITTSTDDIPLPFSHNEKVEKSASVYLKELCAYCSQEIRMRNPSLSLPSSVADSYEDYDIIASQMVHILDDDRTLTADDDEIYSDWAIISMNDPSCCTCIQDNILSRANSVVDDEPNETDNEQDAFICQQVYSPQVSLLDITRIDFFDKDIGWKCLEFFLKANPSLKEFSTSWSEISNDMLADMAQYVKELEFLSLIDCEHVTSEGLSHIAGYCTNMKRIDFKGLPFIRDDAFLQLIHANEKLHYISLAESALTDTVLRKLATNLSSTLRHLDLSWCDNITDDGVVELLSACKKLQYLDFRQCNVSEPTIEAISSNGRHLTTLGLCGIKGLNDLTSQRLFPCLQNIHVIDLSWNSSLTDISLGLLLLSCTHLRDVTVAGLKRITSKPLLPIISEYEQWREVRNKIRSQITSAKRMYSGEKQRKDEFIKHEKLHPWFFLPFRSVNYAAHLRKLTLGYCDKMNDTHLSEIVAVCRGTLIIEDYYGEIIKPCWTGRGWPTSDACDIT